MPNNGMELTALRVVADADTVPLNSEHQGVDETAGGLSWQWIPALAGMTGQTNNTIFSLQIFSLLAAIS